MTYGQYTKGFDLALSEPHVAGSGLTVGLDLYGKQSLASDYQSYGGETYGTTFRLGTALTENLGVQWRYALYNQSTSLSPALMDCSPANPPPGCYANGEASLPVKQAVLNGPAWVSAVGSTINYSTLDNNKSPTSGVNSALSQDLAGLGGDVKFLRTTEDFRAYTPVAGDVVAMVRGQGGYITPWGGQQLPLADGFFGGPQLVRGFAPNGFGPRDLTPGTTMDNVGGRQYWATSAELQAPVPLVPSSSGLKFGLFADAGSVWGYKRRGRALLLGSIAAGFVAIAAAIDASGGFQHHALVARRRPDLGLAVRADPGRLRDTGDQGELRRHPALQVQRRRVLSDPLRCDGAQRPPTPAADGRLASARRSRAGAIRDTNRCAARPGACIGSTLPRGVRCVPFRLHHSICRTACARRCRFPPRPAFAPAFFGRIGMRGGRDFVGAAGGVSHALRALDQGIAGLEHAVEVDGRSPSRYRAAGFRAR